MVARRESKSCSVSSYFEMGLRVVPMLPRQKVPYKAKCQDGQTGWYTLLIDDLDTWQQFAKEHPRCNVAVLWFGCQVDYDSTESIQWAKANGVTSDTAVWVLKTARGWRFFYSAPTKRLQTHTFSNHEKPDLLGPGRLALVPPSIHPSGIPYRWLSGHSPLDIGLNSLTVPPSPILEVWERLSSPVSISRRKSEGPGWLGIVFDGICKSLENSGHRLRSQTNGGFITTCPFHDDHNPSFSIHPEKGWKCFSGCGEGRLTLLAAKLGVKV